MAKEFGEKKYSLIIPVFFVLLTVSATVSIIGNALSLNTSDGGIGIDQSVISNSSQNTIIFKIVLSAILAALFLLLAIFGFIEVFEPDRYKARVLTRDLEESLVRIANRSESFEVLLVVTSFILIPIGLANALITNQSEQLIFALVFLVIAYYTYNRRISTREAIKRALPLNPEMDLTGLSSLVSKDKKYVRKALLYLISYEGFSVHYDHITEKIVYAEPQTSTIVSVAAATASTATEEVVQVGTEDRIETELSPCPYCGAAPLVANAMFCSECGASMIATK